MESLLLFLLGVLLGAYLILVLVAKQFIHHERPGKAFLAFLWGIAHPFPFYKHGYDVGAKQYFERFGYKYDEGDYDD